jgi:two-component system response regulator AtoC
MKNRILIVDDETDFLQSVKRGLITSGYKDIDLESDSRKAAYAVRDGELFDIALIDMNMPQLSGIELLEIIKDQSPLTECIMVTAVDEAKMAVRCLKKGAYDYLVKPISREDLATSVGRALERKRLLEILDIRKTKSKPQLEDQEAFKSIITQSDEMLRVLKEAELHALSDIPILITGETGTGKELLAQAIHAASPRARFEFTALNIESVNPQLFESQFFGYTKGAFTGAEKDQIGYLESTNRGTLFLDEIGNLPIDMQGKLLRFLQEGEFFKIGSTKPTSVNIRLIAATHANLNRMIAKKEFRKDLFYRLRGGWLHLPPLRFRKDDIPLLMSSFIEKICGPDGCDIEQEAMSLLMSYDYPGNVRELKSIIESAINLAQRKQILSEHIRINESVKKRLLETNKASNEDSIVPLQEIEKKYILEAYRKLGKNKSQTARALGIALNTLRTKLESYGET